ncbi:MAG: metallophosphoesterase [Desulfuromonadaceae bacterium]|nr:metallophosphoesterase [Desulfuromonadaceae bacterium]
MKILVISDTHGNYSRALSAHTLSEPVDLIIHLGDGDDDVKVLRDALGITVISVAGNCDAGSNAPREMLSEYMGKRLFLTHGDAYRVKSSLKNLQTRGAELRVDAVLFGHTHIAYSEINSGILFLNPGSLANHSSHRSYAILDVTTDGIFSEHFTID